MQTIRNRASRIAGCLQVDSMRKNRRRRLGGAEGGKSGDHVGLKGEAEAGPVEESDGVVAPDNEIPGGHFWTDDGAFFDLYRHKSAVIKMGRRLTYRLKPSI